MSPDARIHELGEKTSKHHHGVIINILINLQIQQRASQKHRHATSRVAVGYKTSIRIVRKAKSSFENLISDDFIIVKTCWKSYFHDHSFYFPSISRFLINF